MGADEDKTLDDLGSLIKSIKISSIKKAFKILWKISILCCFLFCLGFFIWAVTFSFDDILMNIGFFSLISLGGIASFMELKLNIISNFFRNIFV